VIYPGLFQHLLIGFSLSFYFLFSYSLLTNANGKQIFSKRKEKKWQDNHIQKANCA